MREKKKTTTLAVATTDAPVVLPPVVLPPAVADAAPVRALAAQLRYEGATDPATLENSAREAIRRIGMGIFELGGYLLLLQKACPHGEFLPALERLGIAKSAAYRYMSVTQRFAAKFPPGGSLEAVGVKRMVELLVLDDGQVDELLTLGQTGELALDDVATMSMNELRAAVREAKEERKAQEELSATKSKQIDGLKLKLKRIQAAPPDEVLAELKKEATAIADGLQGGIVGALRAAVIAITSHGEERHQQDVFLAGLLGQVQQQLTHLREEFDLPDVSTAADTPAWAKGN